jgi:rhamnogalacturonan endolyase
VDVSITAQSIVVNGVELAHNLSSVARATRTASTRSTSTPAAEHAARVQRAAGAPVTPDLVESLSWTRPAPLRHEHHLIMRRGKRGLYGYDILTAVANTTSTKCG